MASGAIFFCGDPHGQYDHIVEAVLENRPAAIILLGDNTPRDPLDIELERILTLTQIWWIPGNHDSDTEAFYDNLYGSALADRNLHGRVAEIAGRRVAGLGGLFRGSVWDDPRKSATAPDTFLRTIDKSDRWRAGLPLRHRTVIFRSEVTALAKRRADILVTHDAPQLHPQGSAILGQLAKDMRVTQAYHGHHHQDIKYSGSVWRGVGLHGIVTSEGQTIREGDRHSNLYIGNERF